MYLMIVRRGCEDTFEVLRETFDPRPSIRVVWDRRRVERRQGERRRQGDTTAVPNRRQSDRRRTDRRQATPRTWETVNFLVVKIPEEPGAAPAESVAPPRGDSVQ